MSSKKSGTPSEGSKRPVKKSDLKKVDRLIELAKINENSRLARHRLQWKISLSLWAAYGMVTYFLVKDAHPNVVLCVVATIVYLGGARAHRLHQESVFGANKIDQNWVLYYKDQAESNLGLEIEPRPRPSTGETAAEAGRAEIKKDSYLLTMSIVTYGVALATLFFLWSAVSEQVVKILRGWLCLR